MANKKARRMRKPNIPMTNGRVVEPIPSGRPDWPGAAPAGWTAGRSGPTAAARAGSGSATTPDWRDEYRFIFRDLRRILFLAVGIIGTLIVLSFFIK